MAGLKWLSRIKHGEQKSSWARPVQLESNWQISCIFVRKPYFKLIWDVCAVFQKVVELSIQWKGNDQVQDHIVYKVGLETRVLQSLEEWQQVVSWVKVQALQAQGNTALINDQRQLVGPLESRQVLLLVLIHKQQQKLGLVHMISQVLASIKTIYKIKDSAQL